MWSAVPTKPEFVKNVAFSPCAASIFSILNWSALLSSKPIVTTVVPWACATCAGTVETGASSTAAPERTSASRVLLLICISPLSADAGCLPAERQPRARGQGDGGLHGRVGLDVVLEDGALAVDRGERVDAVRRARGHAAQGAAGGERVRPLHRRAREDGR